MRVRLTRKLANAIDGIDLSRRSVGDVLELPPHDADVLVAEGWAAPAARRRSSRSRTRSERAAVASDRSRKRKS